MPRFASIRHEVRRPLNGGEVRIETVAQAVVQLRALRTAVAHRDQLGQRTHVQRATDGWAKVVQDRSDGEGRVAVMLHWNLQLAPRGDLATAEWVDNT